ncbi:hypothetical protein V8F20_003001 [Naviculisporaceae sp. PSN 640]
MRLPHTPAARAIVGSEFGTVPDTAPKVRLDAIGIWWICFAAVWTAILVAGMAWLWHRRQSPTLRIRGLPLTFAGIVLLHLYWSTVQIGYSVGPLAPEVAEYWIMGVWYPFGIALFQAGNSQFLHVARAQSRFARPPSQMSKGHSDKNTPTKTTVIGRLRDMDYSKRMFAFVTIGMSIQLLAVVIIYMISRKFHPEFGIPGTEVIASSAQELALKQGTGWEWWPSLFWQFLWSWVFAPIILWRSRGIHDIHGWQVQTIACCIAGMPAAPMWLVALYVPAMAPVNAVFIPPQWIAVSIFVIEVFTVSVPCYYVIQEQKLRRETLDLLSQWENKKKGRNDTSKEEDVPPQISSSWSRIGDSISKDPWKKLPSIDNRDLEKVPEEGVLTMAALELVLEKNPEPLRQFSARRDFSGENIGFLTAVAEWKAQLPPSFARNGQNASPEVAQQQFTKALTIYTEFVSTRDAEFPINIAWPESTKLDGVFERAARRMHGDSNRVDIATPFAEVDWASSSRPATQPPGSAQGDSIKMTITSTTNAKSPSFLTPEVTSQHVEGASTESLILEDTLRSGSYCYDGEIPPGFDATVFDAAQADIKYLVLTNTWPKYVRERRPSESSGDTVPDTVITQESERSQASSFRRALAFLKPLIS